MKSKGKILAATVISLIALLVTFFAVATGEDSIIELERPSILEGSEREELEAHILFQDKELIKIVELSVQPAMQSSEEKKSLLQDLWKRLEKDMLGENQSLEQVSMPLALIKEDKVTGLEIQWHSSNTKLMDEQGDIKLLDLDQPVKLELTASVSLEGQEETKTFPVTIDPEITSWNRFNSDFYESEVDRILQEAVQALSSDKSSDTLKLPAFLGSAIQVEWREKSPSPFILLLLPAILISLWYQKKSSQVRKQAAYRNAVIIDLPIFLNKLVLLINAGLVVGTALEKIADDYERQRNTSRQRPFYEEILLMQKRIRNTRSSLTWELQNLGRSSGILELNRFASIITDNLEKGSELTDKLEAEQRLLWFYRKKIAEEKGRVADTKLMIPMMLQLLVILIISTAPAFMSME